MGVRSRPHLGHNPCEELRALKRKSMPQKELLRPHAASAGELANGEKSNDLGRSTPHAAPRRRDGGRETVPLYQSNF